VRTANFGSGTWGQEVKKLVPDEDGKEKGRRGIHVRKRQEKEGVAYKSC